jgi:predicted dehydrogenase
MQKLGVGLVGTGFMGKCHALAYRQVSALFGLPIQPILEHVVDPCLAVAEQFASQFGFKRYSIDWHALIEDKAVDIIAITTPNFLHEEMCLAALAAGKHVHCEKPLALNAASAFKMQQAAEKAGVKTIVGYNYLKSPAVQHAIQLVATGYLGKLYYIAGQYREDYLADPSKAFSWRCSKKEAGSGALGDLGCHLISLLTALAGPIKSLTAAAQTVIPIRDGRTVENEDQLQALLTFENGVQGIFSTSRIGWGRKMGLELEVTGERGTIVFNQEAMNELRVYTKPLSGQMKNDGFKTFLMGPEHPDYSHFCPAPGHGLGYNDLKMIEVKDFLCAIHNNESAYPSFADGYEIELVSEAMLRSADSGTRCEVMSLRSEHRIINSLDEGLR